MNAPYESTRSVIDVFTRLSLIAQHAALNPPPCCYCGSVTNRPFECPQCGAPKNLKEISDGPM